MNEYMIILQICAVLFICFVLYFLYKFVVSVVKKNRLSYFSLDTTKEKYSELNILLKYLFKFSDVLKSLVVFNGISRTYNKYVYEDSKLRNGMDFIAIKIISGFVLILLYLLMVILYKDSISSLLILITFVLGFISIDFYCIGSNKKKRETMNNSIINAIIIMNNSFKANRSIEQSLNDVIERSNDFVKTEFNKVLNDVRLGLSIGDAFLRMYKRTNLKIVLYLSNVFNLVNKSGVSLLDIFNSLENKLLDEEKFNKEIKYLNRVNRFSFIIFMILPVIFVITIIVYNPNYVLLLKNSNGYIVILVIVIVYILYLLMINRLVRGSRYGK